MSLCAVQHPQQPIGVHYLHLPGRLLGGEGPCLLGVEEKFTPSLVLVLQLLSIEKAA